MVTTSDLSVVVTSLALTGTAVNGFMGWNRRRYISIREQEMRGEAMDKLKYILFDAPTMWAELLLGMVKLMLGINLMGYLWDPPKSSAVMGHTQAATIGAAIFLLGFSQICVVLMESKWPRFIVSCIATGLWIFFMGSQWIATGSMRTILIYIPLLVFNVIVAMRIARIRRRAHFGDE